VVKKKFGQAFQKQLRHHANLVRKVDKELASSVRLLTRLSDNSPLDCQLVTLSEFLSECNHATLECFKQGFISSGIHVLRLGQEIALKICAFHNKPKLAEKRRIEPKEVRKVLGNKAANGWAKLYSDLSDVSHHNRSFVEKIYPLLSPNAQISPTCLVLLEIYITLLSNYTMKALYVVNKRLQPRVGQRYAALVGVYNRLHKAVEKDWDTLPSKQQALLSV